MNAQPRPGLSLLVGIGWARLARPQNDVFEGHPYQRASGSEAQPRA